MPTFRAEDILKQSPNLLRLSLMYDWAIEPYNCVPFILRPPPTRPEDERKSICVDSTLCETCRVSLEYVAYIPERYKQSGDDDDKFLEASAITHHRYLNSLLQSMRIDCHICNWLIRNVGLPSIDETDGEGEVTDVIEANTRIELAWDPEFAEDKEIELGQPRLYFAQFDLRKDRTSEDYGSVMRLRIWPSLESANLIVERTPQDLISNRISSECRRDTDEEAENGQDWESVLPNLGSRREDFNDRSGGDSRPSGEDLLHSGHHTEKNEQSWSQTSSISLKLGSRDSELNDLSDRDSQALGTDSQGEDLQSEHDGKEDNHSCHQSLPEEPDHSAFWKCGFTGSSDSQKIAVN